MKMETNKVKILTFKKTSLPGKSQRLEVGFGLFRIIFTVPKKGTSTKLDGNFAAEMKLHTSLHTVTEHGRAYIKILFR